jgi:hypothetical protein
MNLTSPSWMARLDSRDSVFKLVLAAFLIYWICMLPALFGQAPASKAASRALLLPAMLLMYWISASMAARIGRAFAVLGQMQAPHALRRALAGQHLQFVTIAWAMLAAGTSLQLALPQSQASPLCGAALVSLAACLGMLRNRDLEGALPAGLRHLSGAAPWLAGIALLVLDLNRALDRAAMLPPALLVGAALLFPCVAVGLRLRWQRAVPASRWRPAPAGRGVAAAINSLAQRYTVLVWRNGAPSGEAEATSTSDKMMRGVMLVLPMVVIRPIWDDGHIRLADAVTLGVAALMVASSLLVRDLGWRSFVAPGGMRQGRIASHIVASTVPVQLGGVMLGVCLFALVAHFKWGISDERLAAQVMRATLMAAELAFVTTLAVILRRFNSLQMWGTIGGALVLIALMAVLGKASILIFSFPVTLPSYVLGLLLASLLLLAVGNRLWSADLLFAEAGRPGAHRQR